VTVVRPFRSVGREVQRPFTAAPTKIVTCFLFQTKTNTRHFGNVLDGDDDDDDIHAIIKIIFR